jgi:hypothetical protein
MVYARAVPPTGEGEPWRVSLSTAGHPPVLLRHVDGTVEVLDGPTGLLIGVDESADRAAVELLLPPGSTLIAYTDGVVEQAGMDLDEGIAALVERVEAAPAGVTCADLCQHVAPPSPDGRDDIAVLAVRFG